MKSYTKTPKEGNKIYLSIDHLKEGNYELKILLNNKVMKSVTIIKEL